MGPIKHPRKHRYRNYRGQAKLRDHEVREIRRRIAAGERISWIAHDYIIDPELLYRLNRGATYRWVK